MNFFEQLDQLSLTKIISISLFMTILMAIPVGVYLVQHQTRLSSRAAYVKPELMTQAKATPGPVPVLPPQIGRVFPWLGKEGDIVWLQGKHFGQNPASKQLIIGGKVLTEDQIEGWEDGMIQAVIPAGLSQGGVVELKIGHHPATRSLPMVIYNQNTKTKLRKQGNLISVENGSDIVKAIIWTGDDEIPTEQHDLEINDPNHQTAIFDTQGLPLLSILLLDKRGKIVPYYVDPVEWGF